MSKTPINDSLRAKGLTENGAFTELVTMALRGDKKARQEANWLSARWGKRDNSYRELHELTLKEEAETGTIVVTPNA